MTTLFWIRKGGMGGFGGVLGDILSSWFTGSSSTVRRYLASAGIDGWGHVRSVLRGLVRRVFASVMLFDPRDCLGADWLSLDQLTVMRVWYCAVREDHAFRFPFPLPHFIFGYYRVWRRHSFFYLMDI